MKKNLSSLILLLILVFTKYSFSQNLIASFNGNFSPFSIEVSGSNAYVLTSPTSGDSEIYRIDLTSSNPSPVLLADTFAPSAFPALYAIIIHNDIMYISGNETIWSLDLNNANATPQIFYNGSPDVQVYRGMAIIGDTLYVQSLGNTERISSIDLNAATPTLNDVYTHPNTSEVLEGMTTDGNDLFYVVNAEPFRIYKLDLSASPLSATSIYSFNDFIGYDIASDGNDLYFSNTTGQLLKIDLSDSSFPITNIPVSPSAADGLALANNNIYYGATGLYVLEDALSTEEQNITKNKITISPNPVEQTLNISHSGDTNPRFYKILNLEGSILKRGSVINSEINLIDLPSGAYIIQLENGYSSKFIKK